MQTSASTAPSLMRVLDLVGDVRDHLHGGAEVVAAALLGDHVLVDAAGGEVAAAAGGGAHEALVVAEVEVGLGAVVGDEHLAVLERAHGARVDVDVRVELDQGDLEAARLEDRPERRRGNALPQRGNDAAGHADKLGHGGHRRRRSTTGGQSIGSPPSRPPAVPLRSIRCGAPRPAPRPRSASAARARRRATQAHRVPRPAPHRRRGHRPPRFRRPHRCRAVRRAARATRPAPAATCAIRADARRLRGGRLRRAGGPSRSADPAGARGSGRHPSSAAGRGVRGRRD